MKTTKISLVLLVVLGLCRFVLGAWSEPVPVNEVNTEYCEWTPFLSFDGLSLYFARGRPSVDEFRIFQATRPVPCGPFTSVGEVSGTLNSSSGNVMSPWVSPDNLRMYYFTESSLVYDLKVTERASDNDPWPIGMNIPGLDALGGRPQAPCLTANELIIVFSSYNAPGGVGGYDLWMATRPDANSSFGNVRNLAEINTVYKESKPYISPDGLTLYFQTDRNGSGQLFRATRASLSEPFGNLEHLSFFDMPRGGGHPSLSSDGTALYMAKTINGVENIYVSYLGSGASNPTPADGDVIAGEIYVDNIWTRLIFVPGANSVEHTGYFSENYDDVAGRIEDANLGSPPYGHLSGWEFTFMVGNPQVGPAVDSLVRGMTYYWCVDETDAQGNTFPGDIWEFTVQNYKTCCPNPPDGAVVLGPDVLLSWVPGFGVEEYDVYFGTDFNDVNDGSSGPGDPSPPAEYLGTLTETSILVTGLAENTWYYWRVDGVAGRVPPFFIPTEFYKGDVWCFKTAGLIAHWKFDEGSGIDAYDSAGNNDGTIYGAAWASGVIDGALDFDGVDDYVDVGNDKSLMTNGDLTIIAWIKALENRACIYSHTWNGWRLGFGIGNDNYDGRLGFYTWNHRQWIKAGSSLADDIWHHVAVTLNGTQVTLYTDGIEIGGDTGAPASDLTGIGLIGLYNYDWHFGGLIDDVRIYDRALSAGEVEDLYQSQVPVGQTYHVDGVNGDNTNDGLTRETAFKTIQRGINVAEDLDTVLVWPGVYNEEISFWGDAITVRSAADAAIVETNYGYAFSFFSAEGPDTVLSNFVVRNSQYGIYLINGSSPTLRNLTIVNNDFGISAFNGADPDISSCIFFNNYYGDLFRDPVPLEAKYSWVQDEVNEPIAHWKLDEGTGSIAYDSAGTNDGTIYGAAWASGVIDGALDFDGVDDYVGIPDSSSMRNLDGSSAEYTISLWVNTTQQGGLLHDAPTMFDRRATNTLSGKLQWPVQIAINENDAVRFFIHGDDPSLELNDNYAINDGNWHHIMVTRKNTEYVKIYVDGNLRQSGSTDLNPSTTEVTTIGVRRTNYDIYRDYFDGTIDDVQIYDGALSDEEVQRIYQNLAGPLFADAAGGDYHLKSERGRYWPAHDVWVLDDVTSPCIDGGDPAADPPNERMPNGGRINMGAYGNTAYASMSEWPIKGDTNKDGRFNFMDIAILLDEWLEELAWAG
ncbi:MAG: hypothetical protein GWN67_00375 [Phycisphaerae bacterium]|nr:hypothetical protein [Phycisphaerae bacterium]NIP50440.1 hypothetical protein [Phycisphaerae bacterium]NIS49568.1 hypothetical protein [Phycisphaerae bacterium]NIU07326.1 hypothetical protein [Phycisphaerae bacterium]NIU54895.1 hypothetical protein [Phycisphaerae bacterium]